MGGALRHLSGLGKALEVADKHQFLLCVNEDIPLNLSGSRVELLRIANRNSALRLLYWQQIVLPRLIAERNADLVISLLNFGPIWAGVPQINFQRNALYYCPHYLSKINWATSLEITARRWISYLGMRASAYIVTPTHAMKEMIREFYPAIPVGNFVVIRHGFEVESSCKRSSSQFVESVLGRKRRNGEIWLLYAAHPGPHKGLEVLAGAMDEAVRTGLDVTLFLTMAKAELPAVIQDFMDRVERAGVSSRVVLLGRVKPADMPDLYSSFDMFIYPSLCESFGFPLLEAMGAGLPVIAAGTCVNREILGDAALYYSPLDGKEAAKLIGQLAGSDELSRSLRQRSTARVAEGDWDWQRYGHELAELIDIASQKKNYG